MSNFHFRLDRVLEWYRTQLQVEESRLAGCVAALSLVQERIARLQAERLSVERDMISGSSILARDFSSLGFYRLRAKDEAARMDDERVRSEHAVNGQRSAMLAAQRRVRLVEKVRERRLSEHRYEEDRALEGMAAESYLSKWIAARR